MKHVYSTMSADVSYTIYDPRAADLPVIAKQITIKGGANVMPLPLDVHEIAQGAGITPVGAVTEISDTDFEELKKHPVFQIHLKNGYITINDKKVRVEKGIENLKPRDPSAPHTPQFFAENSDLPQPFDLKKDK